jgi:hypothetical protein
MGKLVVVLFVLLTSRLTSLSLALISRGSGFCPLLEQVAWCCRQSLVAFLWRWTVIVILYIKNEYRHLEGDLMLRYFRDGFFLQGDEVFK